MLRVIALVVLAVGFIGRISPAIAEWSYRGWFSGQNRATILSVAKSQGLQRFMDDPNTADYFTMRRNDVFYQFMLCRGRLFSIAESQPLTADAAANRLKAEQLTRGQTEAFTSRLSTIRTGVYPDLTVMVVLSRNENDDARPIKYLVSFTDKAMCK